MNKENKGLYVVEVQPIVRGMREASISYFSNKPYTLGSIIEIPLRKKMYSAIVLSTQGVAEAKAQIKTADFSLRKISDQKERFLLSSKFLELAVRLSDKYATSVGEILSSLVPASVLDSEEVETSLTKKKDPHSSPSKKIRTKLFEGVWIQRLNLYGKEIKKTLAQGQSVLVFVPTIEDATQLSVKLGDPGHTVFALTSRLTKKKQVETWSEISKAKEPVVVILTGSFSSVPVKDVGLCIIEKAGSSQYFGLKKPFLDMRVVATELAKFHGSNLILADILLPLTTLYDIQGGSLKSEVFEELPRVTLVNMVKVKDDTNEKKPFQLISDKLKDETEKALSQGKKVFWFVSRRGLFPSTVCQDCGMIHECNQCGSPLVLHEKGKERLFLCHRCGNREESLISCKNCDSWRLIPLGIGVERVFEEALSMFSSNSENIFLLSQDAAPTKTKAKQIAKVFYTENEGSLLVGTDMAFQYLISKGVDLSAVVSLDSRLSLPLYNAEEISLRILFSVASFAKEKALIQTRQPDNRVFKVKTTENLNSFREAEKSLRQIFKYPPFSHLLTISVKGRKVVAEEQRRNMMQKLQGILTTEDEMLSPPLRGEKRRGEYRASIVLKLKAPLENNKQLQLFLRSLSPAVEVRVEPENLW